MNGLTSKKGWSSLRYTGSPIVDRFTAIATNQEVIKFLDKANEKIVPCNSITVEADAEDLYFSLWRFDKDGDIDTFDFIQEPVYYVKAGDSINISGIAVGGIKFANIATHRYFIQALSY